MTVFLLLSFACSDYEVRAIGTSEEVNWFDEASDRYRDNLEADEAESDTGGAPDAEEERPETPPRDRPEDDGREDGSDPNASDDEAHTPDDRSDELGDGDTEWDDSAPDEEGADEEYDTGIVPGWARGPVPGEIIVSEIMIHPAATDDNVGEWVELRNVGSVWMDLSGHRLADRGVDDTEIVPTYGDSLFVAPGGYLTICAEADYWTNGGVDCDGTFRYWTMGGGFALANMEDEVRLLTADGLLIDEMRYGEGFSTEGDAKGVPVTVSSSLINDDEDTWCDQRSWMSFGDAGTPGFENDPCW